MGFKVGLKNSGGAMNEKFKKQDAVADKTNPKMGRMKGGIVRASDRK